MNVTRSLLTVLLSLFAAAAPADVKGQAALRISPFVGRAIFITSPPATFAVHRSGTTDLVIREDPGCIHRRCPGRDSSQRRMRDRGAVRPPTEVDADALTGGEVEAITYRYGAHVNYHLPDVAGGSPYLSLGAGREAWEYNVEGGEIESQSTLFAGGGVDVRLRGVLRDSPRCQGLDLEAEVAG